MKRNYSLIRHGLKILTAGAGILSLVTGLLAPVFTGTAYADVLTLEVTETFPVNGGQDVFLTSGIEITFNTQTVDMEAFKEAVTISPKTEFYVTTGDKNDTLVIYPVNEYKPETQYTVTIGEGLTSNNGLKLKEDVTFTFNTASENMVKYYQGTMVIPASQGSVMNTLTDEVPAAFLMIDKELAEGFSGGSPEAEVSLYRFASDDDFTKAIVQKLNDQNSYRQEKEKDPSRGRGRADEPDMKFTLKAEPTEDSSYWWWRYKQYVLSFPESLPEGKYLAKLDFPVRTAHQELVITRYLLIQSTELSVFIMASGQDSVAWIHNGTTSEAVGGAQIALNGTGSSMCGETAEDGTARLVRYSGIDAEKENMTDRMFVKKLPSEYRLLTVHDGDHSFIEALTSSVIYNGYSGCFGANYYTNTDYYTYLYTDRQIYSTTDEINYFGIIRPRKEGTALPEKLTVKLGQGWWASNEIVSQEIVPDEAGCFTGVLSFEDQKNVGYAMVTLVDENETVLAQSDSFSLIDYVKPTYTSETVTDKPVYVLGKDRDNEAVVGITVSYFDGTPAADFGLTEEWCSDGLVRSESVFKADQKGHVEEHIAFRAENLPNTWHPQSLTAAYQSADIEDEKLYIDQTLMVIPRDVMLTAENDPDTETLKVSTYAVDTSGIKELSDLYDSENFRGEGLSLKVHGLMIKCWYEKISEGLKYDYIYKRSYEAYHYEYHEDVVQECEIDTTDGEGSFSYHIEKDEANPACYYMKLSVGDSAGREVECTAGISYHSLARYQNNNGSGTAEYWLKALNQKEEVPEDPGSWGWFYQEDNKFSEKEPAAFVLVCNDEEVEMPEGAELLSATVQDGFSDIETGTSPERSVAFAESLIPNYYMTGAYFDGKNVWPLRATGMSFDYETRDLDIRVEGDKEAYQPGETVTVTADITRKEGGNAVPEGTRVVLGVVDEAVFALSEQDIRILQRLYGRFSINYSSYSSRNILSAADTDNAKSANGRYYEDAEEAVETSAVMAPMDGGGAQAEEYIRSEFRDMAYFAMTTTDDTGRATFTFTIPDNMTSWRLSVIAVTDDLWAGSTVTDVICTIPYYTVPVINDIMLEGENFAVGLRSAGTLEDAGECSYEVTVREEGSEEVLLSGTAAAKSLRDYTWVVLDGLKTGNYTVRIRGICGEYTDVSEYPFTVVRSGLEAYASVSGPVSEMREISPLRYPVQLMIYNKDAYVYNAVLSKLLCSKDIRADERLAAHFALTVLAAEEEYYEEMLEDHDISDLKYIFPQFAYAKSNAEISALAYLAVPELIESGVIHGISAEDIAKSLESPYTGSPYAAYLLQALAGDEPEADLKVLVDEESLSFRDRIYVMAALFTAGEKDAAAEAFDKYAMPFLETSEAVSGEVACFLNVDEDTTVQDDTAAALIMASLLHREEARGMAFYLIAKPSDRDIYPLEEVLYLKNCDEKESAACTVSYSLNGETHTETLARNRRIYLNLQKKALESLDLSVVSGEPYVTAFYIAGIDDLTDESTMKLTAEVTLDKEAYKPGDEAKITIKPGIGSLDPTIGCSTMILDVYIPSGMRFERYTPDTGDWKHWYLISREGQRLRFVLYDGSEDRTGDFAPVTFSASCVTPGEYIVEKVYISSNHYDTWGLSERTSVTITAE